MIASLWARICKLAGVSCLHKRAGVPYLHACELAGVPYLHACKLAGVRCLQACKLAAF